MTGEERWIEVLDARGCLETVTKLLRAAGREEALACAARSSEAALTRAVADLNIVRRPIAIAMPQRRLLEGTGARGRVARMVELGDRKLSSDGIPSPDAERSGSRPFRANSAG